MIKALCHCLSQNSRKGNASKKCSTCSGAKEVLNKDKEKKKKKKKKEKEKAKDKSSAKIVQMSAINISSLYQKICLALPAPNAVMKLFTASVTLGKRKPSISKDFKLIQP